METQKYNLFWPLLYAVSHPDVMQWVEQILILLNGDERELTFWKRCWKQWEVALCNLNFSWASAARSHKPRCRGDLCRSGRSLGVWQRSARSHTAPDLIRSNVCLMIFLSSLRLKTCLSHIHPSSVSVLIPFYCILGEQRGKGGEGGRGWLL